MSIRKYAQSDKDRCLEIFRKNIGHSFTEEEFPFFEHWLENHHEYPYYVVELEGVVVACGGIYFDIRYQKAGLAWGMVHPDFQKRGIGRLFTQYRIEQITEQYPGAICFIETTQHAAGFYIKMGFQLRKILKNGFDKGLHRYLLEIEAA